MKKSQSKLKIVIDTNILLSAAIKPNSTASRALRKAINECDIFISEATFAELVEVIQRKKFDAYFTHTEYSRREFLAYFLAFCQKVEISEVITDCLDPKDNKFLEVAIVAEAEMLVSGDKKHLLSMNPYPGIKIVTATEFLGELSPI